VCDAISGVKNLTCTSVTDSLLSRNIAANASVLTLDFGAPFSPPPYDVDYVSIFGKQACVRVRVMLIPGLSLLCLDLPDGRFIRALCGAHMGEGPPEQGHEDAQHEQRWFHERSSPLG
jgi:hypothetical protein